jgi:5-methylcytosine-specific restriction endonuclease McrA
VSEVPYGFCHCGCGEKAPLAVRSRASLGWVEGEPRRFITGHASRKYPPAPEGFKTCPKCGETKELAAFSPNKQTADGANGHCRVCLAAATKAWVARNKEHANAYAAEWYRQNAERLIPLRRERYRADPARHIAYVLKHWNALSEEEKARRTKVNVASRDPERVKAHDATKRAKRAAAPILETVLRSVVWERDGGICGICGEFADPSRWDLDHIVPLTPRAGEPQGEHSYANTQVSHPRCNARKHNRAA